MRPPAREYKARLGEKEAFLAGYWKKGLGRLVWPVPDMESVLNQLEAGLGWLERLNP